MAKRIVITYLTNDYTLEFSRKTVSQMEKEGFVIGDLRSKPLTTYPELFAGAFKLHHRKMKENEINEIYNHLTDKEGFIEKLAEMYADTLNTLFDEPEGDASKNAMWKMEED